MTEPHNQPNNGTSDSTTTVSEQQAQQQEGGMKSKNSSLFFIISLSLVLLGIISILGIATIIYTSSNNNIVNHLQQQMNLMYQSFTSNNAIVSNNNDNSIIDSIAFTSRFNWKENNEIDSNTILHLTQENNLLQKLKMNLPKRDLQNEESQQFIVKLKQVPKYFTKNNHFILNGNLTFAIHGKPSDILQNLNRFIVNNNEIDNTVDNIEWIGSFSEKYKTAIDFEYISKLVKDGKSHLIPTTRSVKLSTVSSKVDNNNVANKVESDNDWIDIKIILIPNFMESTQEEIYNNNLQFISKLNEDFVNTLNLKENVDFTKLELGKIKNILSMSFNVKNTNEITKFLLKQERIHWIERKLEITLQNYVAQRLMQGYLQSTTTNMDTISTPLYDMGIYGEDQLVAVSDTGIDWDMCLFDDSTKTSPTFNSLDKTHRKIVEYNTLTVRVAGKGTYTTNKYDGIDGHGSHVCGTVAGSLDPKYMSLNNINETVGKYHGVAPKSKLYFTSIESSSYGGLLIPDDITSDLLQKPYDAGVKIYTNSWGCNSPIRCEWNCKNCYGQNALGQKVYVTNADCKSLFGAETCCSICNKYDSQAVEIDEFLTEKQDAVILYSAGNTGDMGTTTITSPSTSKNGICVGASSTTLNGFIQSVDYEDFYEKAKQIRMTPSQCCTYTGANQDLVRNYCCPSTVAAKYKTSNDANFLFGSENLAYFSSKGPAIGNRIKPDLVGVGNKVVSAHSDGKTTSHQCGTISPNLDNSAALLTMQGTSMASPATAGTTALLREYLIKKVGITAPSGPLVKSALIHSTIPLQGYVSLSSDESGNFFKLSELNSPNVYEGHGAVHLQSLFATVDGKNLKTKYLDNQVIASTNDKLKLCFKSKLGNQSGKSNFRATLVWYDPANSAATIPSLINDLDMAVGVYQNGTNNKKFYFGNNLNDFDRFNTVEKLSLTDNIPQNGIITLQVNAFKLSTQSQLYSLVVSYDDSVVEEVLDINSCQFDTPVPNPENIDWKLIVAIVVPVGAVALLVCLVVIGLLVRMILNRRKAYGHAQLSDESTYLKYNKA
ncbi:hypothetical protein ABK040_005170 [Willaertia magna]